MGHRLFAALCAVFIVHATASAQDEPGQDKIENRAAAAQETTGALLRRIQEFVVNPARTDPYKRVNFRVMWEGRVVPGVVYVSPISRRTQAISYRDGTDAANRRATPGLTTIQPVVLRRGVTHDDAFEKWADEVWNPAGASAMSLKNYRKDVRVDLLNLSGQIVKSYMLYRCWPTEYVALDALNAGADLAAEEKLTIQCDGWERDKAVREPAEE